MRQTIEKVSLGDNDIVTMVTTYLLEGVKLIICADENDAVLMINDTDIQITYSQELASIIENLGDHTAMELLMALAQVDRLAS